MTILVTGANGQLGSELRALLCRSRENRNPIKDELTKNGKTDCDNFIFVDCEQLDIIDQRAVEYFFSIRKPDYCINAAAYTDVEKAEDERDAAYAVNAIGAKNIAKTCAKNNVILFHISTDFVFDGEKIVPYAENDKPHPLGAYAQTKYEGERAVQEHCERAFIIRTSWLYSSFGKNFVKTILRLCCERDSLSVVADQYGSPTYARDLAKALLKMIDVCEVHRHPVPQIAVDGKLREGRRTSNHTSGPLTDVRDDGFFSIYHYANDGEVTWFEFAQKVRDIAGLSCELKPIPASEYQSKAARPCYSALSTKKIQSTFGISIPEWDESLKECLALLETGTDTD